MEWLFIIPVLVFLMFCIGILADPSCMSVGDHWHNHDADWLDRELERMEKRAEQQRWTLQPNERSEDGRDHD